MQARPIRCLGVRRLDPPSLAVQLNNRLDPCLIALPHYTWDASMKAVKVRLAGLSICFRAAKASLKLNR